MSLNVRPDRRLFFLPCGDKCEGVFLYVCALGKERFMLLIGPKLYARRKCMLGAQRDKYGNMEMYSLD